MHFCDKCNNMYYIKLEDNDCNKISYYCRNCGNTDNNLINKSKCILKESFNNNQLDDNDLEKIAVDETKKANEV